MFSLHVMTSGKVNAHGRLQHMNKRLLDAAKLSSHIMEELIGSDIKCDRSDGADACKHAYD